jgi:hypothetical protein
LNIAEKSWSKLCQHCAIFLSDNDIKGLAEIQSLIVGWKENMNDLRTQLNLKDKQMSALLEKSKVELNNLKNILRKDSLCVEFLFLSIFFLNDILNFDLTFESEKQ